MTVRDKVEEESPDGRVLYIKDLRECLGVGTSDCDDTVSDEASNPIDTPKICVEVLLIGHDLRGDFPKMRAEGIRFDPYFDYLGCIDTHVIVEDTDREYFPKSLGRLVQYYGLASGRMVRPKNLPASKAKFVFFGGHNAGNDAIATLKVAIAQAFDPEIGTMFCRQPKKEANLTSEFLSKPLLGMKKNMVLLAYDSEGVESNRYDRQRRLLGPATTEHGFAWLNLVEVADVPPGTDGVNWHPYIRARHWLNWEYRNFANFKYVVGNPRGFWKNYGETKYYFESEGPVPFHEMFRDIACAAIVAKESPEASEKATVKENATLEQVTSLLEKTILGESFPVIEGGVAVTVSSNHFTRGKSQRGRGNFRGFPSRGRARGSSHRGSIPGCGGTSSRGDEHEASDRGKVPSRRGFSTRGRVRRQNIGART